MKPLNHDDPGCNYTSSNCIIWQGPDIECIHLCKGDTISDVVFKLATELCAIMEMLDVDSYDLSCLNITTCTPASFMELFQLIITQICTLQQIEAEQQARIVGSLTNSGTSCPDCIVPISSCFYYNDPRTGDQVTSMQILDYVTLIGNTICGIVSQINTINLTLNDFSSRIVALENAPVPTFTLPQIYPSCVMPNVLTDIDVVLSALEQQFCRLRNATGDETILYTNIQKQPAGLNNAPKLNGTGGTMSGYSGWTSTVVNVADSIGNIWITLADLRQAVRTIQINCCPTGCDGIEINMYAILNGTLFTIYFNGTIPSGFVECNGIGTQFTITDTYGASSLYTIPLVFNMNNPSGYTLNLAGTPLNLASDLTISGNPCLSNNTTGVTCESCIEYVYVNVVSCPEMTVTPIYDSIQYDFMTTIGLKTYSVELWSGDGLTLLSNQIHSSSIVQTITGTFNTLLLGTNYRVRLVITPDGSSSSISCVFYAVSTYPNPCPEPEEVVAVITCATCP